MAVHAHSTTAPVVQTGLLRPFAGAALVSAPTLTAETVAMLDALDDTFELPPEPLLEPLPFNLGHMHRSQPQQDSCGTRRA